MYERLIKEIKKTLYKTMGRSHLRYEQMESVVMDIERHLNNRPLTYVESDNGEEQVLTPNVIMWGQNSHTVEDIEIEGDEVSKLHARLMLKRQQVWQRWKKEYVHSLMESHRVHIGVSRVPEIGEIVLLVGDEKNRG
jgi:sporulation protein YlmC with PRC-barrel domain